MELQESDESNTLKKAPIDGLTKEELLKKYRQAILIAQKAKESKAGLLQHISKHEDTIKLLEDRLIKAVEEKKIEADLRANAEIELENTREVLANIKQENISATSPLVTYDNIHKECVSKVHISEDKVKTLEAKLLEVSNDLNTLGDSKLMLEKILVEKDNEIKSLIKHQNNENKVFEKCKTDLESEIHQLKDSLETETRQIIARSEESEKEIRSLEELLLQKDQDLKDLNSHFNDLKFSFEKLNEEQCERQSLLFNCENENAKLLLALEKLQKVIDEQSSDDTVAQLTSRNVELEQEIALKNEEILSRNEAMSQLSTECKETKDSLDQLKQLSKENFSKLQYLQGENTSYHQTISFLEKQKEEICYQVEELTRNIEEQSERNSNVEQKLFSVQEELLKKENMIAQLSTELQEAKYSSDQLDKEYFSREDAIRSENSSLLQKIATLESEKTMLQETLSQNLEREMKDVKSETDTDEREIKNLQHLQTLLGERNEIISKMDIDMQSLSATLLEKEQNINLMAEEIRNVLGVLQERNLEIAKKDEVVAEMSRELAEAKNAMKILETQKFELSLSLEQAKENLEMMSKDSEEYVTKYATAIQDTEELHGQLNALQNTLQGKEFLIQDLELEISKLKDAVAHETTNTEVSSTFSLSRSEEISRMKDLEDSFEDKYTKLRVVAVKLKKRVTDLTQTLEGERSKMAAERSEFQAKLTQQASVAKTVQILQSEMDLLHDALDKQVKAYNQLSKDLESAVSEAASRKFELASTQEELLHAVNEQKSLEITIANMKSSVLMTEGLQVEIDQLRKEVEEKNCILDSLKDEKHKLCEQLEKVCSDAKKKSVLSLEMADLEKSVSELTRQLSSERDCLKQTTDALEQEHKLSISLQSKIRELEEKVNEKDRLCETLKEKLLSVREEEDSLKIRYKEKEIAVEELSALLEKQRSEIEELNLQCSDIASKQVQTKEVARQQIETLSRQIFQLEEQCTSVKEANKALQDELALVRTDFDNYKVRAQSVLRQSAKQEDRLLTSSTVHDAEELEVEVERLRVNVSSLNTNLKQTMSQLQGALQEVNVEREEKLRAFKQAQSYKDSCAEAVERQHAAEERLSAIIEESKQAKLHADTLIQCYKQQLEDLKTSHQKKVTALTEQLENLKASMKNSPAASHENERALSAQSNPSPVVDWAGQSPNTGQPDGDLAIRLSSLQREEGEGSESVDSFPTRRISVISQEKRHELVPLEKLLSSPTYPESDTTEDTRPTSVDKNVELLQSKLNACESRAAHLTALLSEAESDAARFSQLNIVLKEEIRRQQRCEERAQHAHNLEYLKNIVVKFITLQNGDERQRLVPVLNTILKLSPEEASLIAIVAKGSTQANNTARGWGSYLPLPGWSGS